MLSRKAFLITVTKYIDYFTGWLGLFFIARFMADPDFNYGVVQFALGFVSMFSFVGTFFKSAHVKRLSGGELDEDKCMGTYISLKSLATLVTFLAIFGSLMIWKYGLGRGFETPEHETAIYIITGYFILTSIGHIAKYTFQAKKQIARMESLRVMTGTIPTIFIIFVAVTEGEAIELALTYVAGSALMALLAIFYLRDVKIKKPDRSSIKSYWDFALPGFFSKIVSRFGNKVDIVMVQLFWSSTNVGYYAAGQQVAGVVSGLVAGVGTVIFPAISELHAKGDLESIKNTVKTAARYSSLIMCPVVVFLIIFPHEVIHIMVSDRFLPAAPVIRILAINSFFLIYFKPFRYTILGMDRPKLSARISIMGNLGNVALNILLIPDSLFGVPLMGMKEVGAAIATLTAGVSISLAKFFVSKKLADVSFTWGTLYHIGAAAISGLILFVLEMRLLPITRFYHLFIYGGLMLAIYAVILYLVGEFTEKEWHYLMEVAHPGKLLKYIKDEISGRKS